MSAFRAAIERHADSVGGVELDVQTTRDGRLAVFHDPDVQYLTDGHGPLCEMSWQQVSALRYKRTDADATVAIDASGDALLERPEARIPLLEEVLNYCWSRDCVVMIEVKEPNGMVTLRGVLDLLARMERARQKDGAASVYSMCWLACFNPAVLWHAARAEPRLLTCLIVQGSPVQYLLGRSSEQEQTLDSSDKAIRDAIFEHRVARLIATTLLLRRLFDWLFNALVSHRLAHFAIGISFIAVSPELATASLRRQCVQNNVAALCWTINDVENRAELERLGYGIITDTAM
jgi:glycerophosphoryl diester phosphodiesterase